MHRSPAISAEHCRRAALLLQQASCDLLVNLGDNVTRLADYAPSALAPFAEIKPPAGKFAVLGNHDHWADARQVSQALEDAGFRVLIDEHIMLARAGQKLCLVGMNDLWSSPPPNFDAAFAGVPDDTCAIVLSHNPDAIYHAQVREADLVLSGHTHGGQILWMNRLVPNCHYGRAHPHGLYREGKTQIYVTSGVGMVHPAVRFGVPPEVVVITLS